MRSFLLLVLACVVFTVSTVDIERILLEESIASAQDILHKGSKEILEQFAKNVFITWGCSAKTLSQTAAVLKNTQLNHSQLHRQLHKYAQYTGHINSIVPAADEHLMQVILKETIRCCRNMNSLKKPKKHH